MRTLLLIPSALKQGIEQEVRDGKHPQMDYYALAKYLRENTGQVDLIGYADIEADPHPLLRLTRRVAGRDVALAVYGAIHANRYQAIFTNGENVGIPLSLLLKGKRDRPGHVTIAHRPSTGKKRLFFQNLRADEQMDTLLLYATTQSDFAQRELGIAPEKLRRIEFHADENFFKPQLDVAVDPAQICAAGLEWRDYPTLIAAMKTLPNLTLRIAAASPWSKHRNETEKRTLPNNVSAKRYAYNELRDLYAHSHIVAVPLYENDFQAGITTLLEAMAMGKAVIITRTTGQTDVITDGENGLCVAPGDIEGWKQAILKLHNDVALRQHLGMNALRWVRENATLGKWSREVATALHNATTDRIPARQSVSDRSVDQTLSAVTPQPHTLNTQRRISQ